MNFAGGAGPTGSFTYMDAPATSPQASAIPQVQQQQSFHYPPRPQFHQQFVSSVQYDQQPSFQFALPNQCQQHLYQNVPQTQIPNVHPMQFQRHPMNCNISQAQFCQQPLSPIQQQLEYQRRMFNNYTPQSNWHQQQGPTNAPQMRYPQQTTQPMHNNVPQPPPQYQQQPRSQIEEQLEYQRRMFHNYPPHTQPNVMNVPQAQFQQPMSGSVSQPPVNERPRFQQGPHGPREWPLYSNVSDSDLQKQSDAPVAQGEKRRKKKKIDHEMQSDPNMDMKFKANDVKVRVRKDGLRKGGKSNRKQPGEVTKKSISTGTKNKRIQTPQESFGNDEEHESVTIKVVRM